MTRCAGSPVGQGGEGVIDRRDGYLAVAVSPPRLLALVGWFIVTSGAASVACGMLWLGFPWSAAGPGASVPLLAHYALGMRSRSGSVTGDLVAFPGGPWRLPDGRDVAFVQAWHHIFGLTLTFNCAIRPHNASERLTLTIWRCNVPAETYRRLSVMVAWQLLRPRKVFIRETV